MTAVAPAAVTIQSPVATGWPSFATAVLPADSTVTLPARCVSAAPAGGVLLLGRVGGGTAKQQGGQQSYRSHAGSIRGKA